MAGFSFHLFVERQIELNLAATHSELNTQSVDTRKNSELDESRAHLRDVSGMVIQELAEALAIKRAFEDETAIKDDSEQLELRQTAVQRIAVDQRLLETHGTGSLQSEQLRDFCFNYQKQRLLESSLEVWRDFGEDVSAWYAPLHNQRALSFSHRGSRRLHEDNSATHSAALGQRSLGGRFLLLLQWATCILMAYALIGYMMPGGQRDTGPRNHAHVGDAGPPYVGTATLKVPPAWSVERSQTYSLRSWISDLILWSTATDLEAHRLGPIAALQVTGSAKELVRELTPEQLANGQVDPQTGQHVTGLMILVRTLAQRYAPLEQETQTKAVSEFLAFARQAGESVDALLVRFDVLRNRAALRGGLGMNAAGLSWLLLRALNLPPDLLDRLLAPLGGQMPQNDAQLAELMQRVRRQGHLYEQGYRHSHRQGGVGDPGTYYFPVVPGSGSVAGPGSGSTWDVPYSPVDPFGPCAGINNEPGMPSNATVNSNHDAHSYAAGTWHDPCPTCGMYYADDDDVSSMTSSDDGSYDAGAMAFASVDVMGQMRGDDDAIASELYLQYRAARKKWRRFTGKVPRRYRKGKGKGTGHGGKNPYRSYASFLPPGAFAGGKGKGKGKGNRTNPRGRDGKVLRCSKCNSDQHLWRQCPLVAQPASASSHYAQPAFQPAIALHSSASAPPLGSEIREIPTEVRSLPGVTFSSHYVSANSQTGLSFRTGVDRELDALSQVSVSVSSRAKRTRQEVTDTVAGEAQPPSWEPGHAPTIRPEDSISQASAGGNDRGVTELVPGSHAPLYPPPTNAAPQMRQEQTNERNRATLQLQSLLYGTWWEATDGTRGPVEHSDAC